MLRNHILSKTCYRSLVGRLSSVGVSPTTNVIRTVENSLVLRSSLATPKFSSHSTPKNANRDELYESNFGDKLDESDFLEFGKQATIEKKIPQGSKDNTEETDSSVPSQTNPVERTIKEAKAMGQKAVGKAKDAASAIKKNMQELSTPSASVSGSSSRTLSEEEVKQKTYTDAFDESDSIEIGKKATGKIAKPK